MAKKSLALILILLFVLISSVKLTVVQATSEPETLLEEIWLTGAQLEQGIGISNPGALSPTSTITAPLPFI